MRGGRREGEGGRTSASASVSRPALSSPLSRPWTARTRPSRRWAKSVDRAGTGSVAVRSGGVRASGSRGPLAPGAREQGKEGGGERTDAHDARLVSPQELPHALLPSHPLNPPHAPRLGCDVEPGRVDLDAEERDGADSEAYEGERGGEGEGDEEEREGEGGGRVDWASGRLSVSEARRGEAREGGGPDALRTEGSSTAAGAASSCTCPRAIDTADATDKPLLPLVKKSVSVDPSVRA